MTPEAPFAPVHSRQSFLETPGGGGVLRRLDDGLGAREPFLLLTGDPGTGKTAIVHEAVARWGSRVTAAFLAYPALTGAEFLEEIVRRFGAEPADGASRSKLVACVERSLADIAGRGQIAVLVVDDAHNLSLELLEELRLLVNAAQQARLPLEVLLVGLPALETRLSQPAIAALRQRVSIHAKLEPLSPLETRRYLHHRVTAAGGDGPTLFSRKTCREIAARTHGVPRQINALAAEALRVAQVWGDQTVGVEHVQTAAAALGGFAPTGAAEDSDDADSRSARAPAVAVSEAAASSAAADAPASTHAASKPAVPSAAPASADVGGAPVSEAPSAVPAPAVVPAASVAATPSAVPAPAVVPAASIAAAPSAAPAAAMIAEAPAAATPSSVPAPSEAPAAPAPPAATSPTFTPPTAHDPREWVARISGDQGPIQLSSRAAPETTWEPESLMAGRAESPIASDAPPRSRRRGDRVIGWSRPRTRNSAQVAITAALAAILVASTIALVVHGSHLAGSRAGQGAGAATTGSAPQAGDKAATQERGSSPAASRSGSGGAEVTPPPAVEERRVDDPSAGSRGPFTIDVGGFREFERALEQRDRLQRLTGFEGWVISAARGEERPYRVVLGVYRNRQRATDAANMLVNSRTLPYAVAVPLPPRSARR